MLTGDLNPLHNLDLVIRINNHILAFLLPRFSDNKCANPSQEDPSSSIHFLQSPRIPQLIGSLHPSLALLLKLCLAQLGHGAYYFSHSETNVMLTPDIKSKPSPSFSATKTAPLRTYKNTKVSTK